MHVLQRSRVHAALAFELVEQSARISSKTGLPATIRHKQKHQSAKVSQEALLGMFCVPSSSQHEKQLQHNSKLIGCWQATGSNDKICR